MERDRPSPSEIELPPMRPYTLEQKLDVLLGIMREQNALIDALQGQLEALQVKVAMLEVRQ